MPMNALEALRAAGAEPDRVRLTPENLQEVERLLQQGRSDSDHVVVQYLKACFERDHAKRHCASAAEAAEKLEATLDELLSGNAVLCRLEALINTPSGLRAVCRVSGHLRELPIHPAVDLEQLGKLCSWDYVKVHEQVVVGYWTEPRLFAEALGEVVEFRGYQDRDLHLVRVARGPEERVVVLDESLRNTVLAPRARLVLHRDDPHRAIGIVPLELTTSRFEVPIDKLSTRLGDLAGVEEIAERLIEDILLRIYFPEIRDRFGLDPLKGLLLYSYKPGMGKTAFMRAIALWLHEHREQLGFDVVLYVVKPNETKSMWHGEDARIVREDLWGAVRARQQRPRERALVQLIVIDEIDSLGKRAARGEQMLSAAQSDALEAMLVEMDGLVQEPAGDGPPVYVLCAGMTNRPDRVDDAAKRPGRFDLVLPMPEVDQEGAENVMAIYARGASLPWYLGGEVHSGLDEQVVRTEFLRPALGQVFSAIVLRYKTDQQRSVDVTAREILSNAHYKDAVNRAKKRAAVRHLRNAGIPAVAFDDVLESLLDVACEAARQMVADPAMLIRQLDINVPVAQVNIVPRKELEGHRYLRRHTAQPTA